MLTELMDLTSTFDLFFQKKNSKTLEFYSPLPEYDQILQAGNNLCINTK